jgi:transcriptional regulator with XRE-family HTH domain
MEVINLKWLIDIRQQEGISQTKVADKVKISKQYYNMIEAGTRGKSIRGSLAKSIAAALHFERYGIDWTRFYEDDARTSA